MALPVPEGFREGSIAVVGIWALLQHHLVIFYRADPGLLKPTAAREGRGRENGDGHGVARLQAAPLVQPICGRDQDLVRASGDLSRRGARVLQGCGRSWAV